MRNMPLFYLRRLTERHRVGCRESASCLVSGAVIGASNAGGFFAVHRYTSHMSGVVASTADNTALGNAAL